MGNFSYCEDASIWHLQAGPRAKTPGKVFLASRTQRKYLMIKIRILLADDTPPFGTLWKHCYSRPLTPSDQYLMARLSSRLL
jgi:hypothetical protein